MANDHYVAKTYLKHFAGPDGRLRAYRKSDGVTYSRKPDDLCKEPDGDIIPDFLSEPAYLGEFRKAFEPLWNGSIASLQAHSVDMRDKLHIAGYWANLLVCTPAWRRVAIEASNQRVSHTLAAHYLLSEQMGKADPKIKEAIEAEQRGEIVIETEADYVRAQAAQSALKYAWGIYNAMWDVYENDTDIPFVTSDNPASIIDQGDNNWNSGIPYVRLLPITPKLCLRCDLTLVPEQIREAQPDFTKLPHEGVRGGPIDINTVKKINAWVARCAEEIVLTGAESDYVRDLTKANAKYRVLTQSARFPERKGFLIANRTRVIQQEPVI